MKEYIVGIRVYNCFNIEAKDKDEAIQKVRDMNNEEIMLDCDFNIDYADENESEETN